MSILNDQPINQPQQADIVAQRLVHITRRTYQQMVNSFNEGSKIFWQNPEGLSPSEIAASLGTNAKELFELHYALGQLINNIKPKDIEESLQSIGTFTMNEDGSVTVINNNKI